MTSTPRNIESSAMTKIKTLSARLSWIERLTPPETVVLEPSGVYTEKLSMPHANSAKPRTERRREERGASTVPPRPRCKRRSVISRKVARWSNGVSGEAAFVISTVGVRELERDRESLRGIKP